LAGRKLVALFGRAEARDFADVYVLAQRFDRGLLLERAAEIDGGFGEHVLATMMRTLSRFMDAEIPIDPVLVADLRSRGRASSGSDAAAPDPEARRSSRCGG